MVKIGDILQIMRIEAGLMQEDVAAKLDVDPETISRWERAERLPKRGNTIRRMVEVYGANMDELLARWRSGTKISPQLAEKVQKIEQEGASPQYMKEVGSQKPAPSPGTRVRPIHGGDDIAAGGPIENVKDFDPGDAHEYLPGEIYSRDDNAFFVRVLGASMYPDFKQGDIVIGSPALRDQVESGDVVCVRFTKESRFRGGRTLKRITLLNEKMVRLESLNPAVANIGEVLLDEIDEFGLGPCVVHIKHLWKDAGYAIGETPEARRVMDPQTTKAPLGEERQEFPDYDGPQGSPQE